VQWCDAQAEDLHGPQAAVLPGHPLLGDRVVVRIDREAEFVFRIVVSGEIGQDSQPFEDGEAIAVVVDNSRDAPVGVERRVPGLLLDVLADVDGLVGVLLPVDFLELFQKNGGFEPVRGA